MQSKGLDLSRKLVDARVPDLRTRTNALDAVVACDPRAGAAFLGTLLEDKALGSDAKTKLDALKKQAKK